MGVEIVGAIGRRPGRREIVCTGVSTDSRTVREGEMFFALAGARSDGHDFAAQALEQGAAAVVVSRETPVSPEHHDRVVLVEDVLAALGRSANAYRRRWGGLVVAVTGSNGKTTTREMIYHVLSEQLACNRSPRSFNTDVGVPLTLFQARPKDVVMIVEMGTNAPGEIAALGRIAEPNLGVITNIGHSHLEGLHSLQGVARAKGELLEALGPRGAAFLNRDDAFYDLLAGMHPGRVVSFGLSPNADFRGTEVGQEGTGYAFTIPGNLRVRLAAPGRHNVPNALAALAVVRHLGLDVGRAAARLADFRLPDMRFQVEQIGGVTVVTDCYNANPSSMAAALETLRETAHTGRTAAVLGDMLELGDQSEALHAQLGADVARLEFDALWAVGRYSTGVTSAAGRAGLKGPAVPAMELDQVSGEVCDYLRPGDAVLIKGSRGMKLERLLEKLRETLPVRS